MNDPSGAPTGPSTGEITPQAAHPAAGEELTSHPSVGKRPRPGVHVRVHTFDSLTNHNFRLLWVSTFSMSGAFWNQQVVLGWLTFDVTKSPLLTSLAMGVNSLPLLFAAPVGGAIADTWDRRKVFAIASFCQGLIAAAFAVIVMLDRTEVWHIFAFVLAMGSTAVVSGPAREAMIPSVVPRQSLVNALALNSLAMSVARMVTPALGGLIIAARGPGLALVVNVALYVTAALVVLPVRLIGDDRRRVRSASPFRQMVAAIRYVRGERQVMTLLVLGLIPFLVMIPFINGLMPVYASEVFHVGPAGLGLLVTSMGAGNMIGAVIVATAGDVAKRGGVVVLALALAVAAMAAFAASSALVPSVLILVLFNAGTVTFFSVSGAIILSIVPDELRGRVVALSLMSIGMVALGSPLSGGIAEWLDAPSATMIGAGAAAVLLAGLSINFRHTWKLA